MGHGQAGIEYLLLLGGIIVIGLLISSIMLSASQNVATTLTSYNAPEVNYPTYTDKPPVVLDIEVSPDPAYENNDVTLYCLGSDDVELVSISILVNGSTKNVCYGPDVSTYSCSYTDVFSSGTYVFECVVYDSNGQTSSSSLTFIVFPPPSGGAPPSNNPPSITILSPSDGSSFAAPANVTVSWTSSDSDGTVVSHYIDCGNGTTATVSGSTTSYTCSYSSAGTYSIYVSATDDDGASASDSVSITVYSSGGGAPPGGDTNSPVILSFYLSSPYGVSTTCAPDGVESNIVCRGVDYETTFTVYLYYDTGNAPIALESNTPTNPATVVYTFVPTQSVTFRCEVKDAYANTAVEYLDLEKHGVPTGSISVDNSAPLSASVSYLAHDLDNVCVGATLYVKNKYGSTVSTDSCSGPCDGNPNTDEQCSGSVYLTNVSPGRYFATLEVTGNPYCGFTYTTSASFCVNECSAGDSRLVPTDDPCPTNPNLCVVLQQECTRSTSDSCYYWETVNTICGPCST